MLKADKLASGFLLCFYVETMDCERLLKEFTKRIGKILKDNLTGIYLHGSLAMGCFNPRKSDVDLIVIVEDVIPDSQKIRLMQQIVQLNEQAPPKGLELSFVLRKYCNPLIYPTPFELHFSEIHLKSFQDHPIRYIETMKGEDSDLAAHFSIIRRFGIVLCGEKIDRVFAEVPEEYFQKSVYEDIRNAVSEITDHPVYIILNLCRVLAFLKNKLYLSKKEGGMWGREHLPKYREILSEALECYVSDRDMKTDCTELRCFAAEMLQRIESKMYAD